MASAQENLASELVISTSGLLKVAQATADTLEHAGRAITQLRQDVTSLALDRATDRLALREAERRIRELEARIESWEG